MATNMRVPKADVTQDNNEKTSNKPPNFKFVQQRLPSYYPVLDTGHVLPTLFLLSAIFISLGIGIWLFSENIQEITIPYTNCTSLEFPHLPCEDVIRGNKSIEMFSIEKKRNICTAYEASSRNTDCKCRVDFELDKPMNGSVYLFYALTNFNQNHLKYYTSRDENQLRGNLGEILDLKKPSSSCKPCDYEFPDRDDSDDNLGRIIFPCGLQANTMFNDVIDLIHIDKELYPLLQDGERYVPLIRTGIAWESDIEKFENPKDFNNTKLPLWLKFTKPWGWKKSLWELDRNQSNNGLQNEDFIVWMRTAAFPNFKKLYRIVDASSSPFENGLPAGKYSLFIEYNYEVSSFKGTKAIILSTTRMSGGRNHFLGIAYMVVGAILMVLTLVFFGVYIMTRKRNMEFKND